MTSEADPAKSDHVDMTDGDGERRHDRSAAPDAIVDARVVHRGWFDLLRTRILLNGVEEDRVLVDHPSGAAVLLYDGHRRTALVTRQTRDAPLWLGHPAFCEAVAGVNEGEDPADTARREAMEEVGVEPRSLERVGRVWMTPSSTTERVDLFLGEYGAEDHLAAVGGAAGENERIDIAEVPLSMLWAMVADAEMADAKLLMLTQALRLRHPALFE